MKFSTASLRAIVLCIAFAQIGIATASRPDISNERDLSEADVVNTDQYWLPQLNSVGVQCGGTSMKTGDGGEYRCFRDGEGICRDDKLGSFGPGQWTFGIVDRNVTLYTPANELSWHFCSEVTHVCIGEDHGTDGGQWYSQERPYLFFYNERTHQYVGELTCDGTDGDDGENLGKPSILKMVELSHTGQYVDYGEEGIAVTKFKKGQTEDPDDNNALFEILVKKEGMNVIGDAYYNSDKCYWEQTCTNCDDELYDLFDFEFDFDLATFCAENIPLDENVAAEFQAVLLRFLNEDAECVDAEAGVIGCTDEIYFDIDILEFLNSNETCGTVNGTSTLQTTRMLWEKEEGNAVDKYPADARPGLIRGTGITSTDQGDLYDNRRLRRNIGSRRSSGRARGRGRCRRCRRRNKNNRKLVGLNDDFDSIAKTKPVRRSLQPEVDDLECPVDLAKLFREQNATLFENVTEADVFNFNYLPATAPGPECDTNSDCASGSICNAGTCVLEGSPRFTLTWTGEDDLDLYVQTPGGAIIWYGEDFDPITNGTLDKDKIPDKPGTYTENTIFPNGPAGNYTVYVYQEALMGSRDPFIFQIFDDSISSFDDSISSTALYTYDGSGGLGASESTPCFYYTRPGGGISESAGPCPEFPGVARQ